MQVILLQDVAKIGRRYDVVSVADGYGLNKLIPQGMAEPATPENMKKIKAQAVKTEADRAASSASFAEVSTALSGKVVDVKAEANEEGKLYQTLKAEEVVVAITQALETTVATDQVVIKTPIKQLGEHTIEVASGEESAALTINVIAG